MTTTKQTQTRKKNTNSKLPNHRHALTCLSSTARLQYYITHAKRIEKVNMILQKNLPSDLSRHVTCVNILPQQISLAGDSPAWSQRLRLICNSLLPHLQKQFPECRRINIKTITNTTREIKREKKCVAMRTAGNTSLQQLAGSCKNQNLSDALKRLLQPIK